MKDWVIASTATIVLMTLLGSGIAYKQNEFDYLFEPKPEVGQIWFPNYEAVQSYWPSILEEEVDEVKGDFIRTKHFGSQSVYARQEFHAKFNFARKDTSLTQ